VLGSALLWRVANRKDGFDGDVSIGAAVEVVDAVFEHGAHGVHYEASDLLYGSDVYSSYAAEHFGGMGIPSTLVQLMDLRLLVWTFSFPLVCSLCQRADNLIIFLFFCISAILYQSRPKSQASGTRLDMGHSQSPHAQRT